jgi:elongation factor Ts
MAVSAQDVKKLRDMTNAGMMDCKEALTETGGDFDAAVDLLRKKGLSRAAKKAGRETKEGVVAAFVRPDAQAGSMVEVNCETDFVARTEDFKTFVADAVAHVDEKAPGAAAELLDQPWVRDPQRSAQNVLAELIGKLGENMQITRVVHFKAPANGSVHAYIHPGARVGVLIEAAADKSGAETTEPFAHLVHDLAMQVAAAQARFVHRGEVDAATVEHEKGIYREQLKESGKPPQVIEKIIEGKINAYFSEVCLLEQPFIKDPDTKVQDLVQKVGKEIGAGLTVTRFCRFALGEGL